MEKLKKEDVLFVIGSGVSLNKVDVTKLKGYHTISLNRQYIAYDEWGFTPTYYMVIDPLLTITLRKDIEKLISDKNGIKKFYFMGDNQGWFNKVKSQEGDRVVLLSPGGKRGNEKLFKGGGIENRTMNFAGNAGACAVELALQLGYKRVILLGIDAHYIKREDSIKSKKDLSHFHPKYFDVGGFVEGKDVGINIPESGILYWEVFSRQQKSIPNFEILSSSPDSKINQFLEYVEFEELLNKID